MAYLGKLNRKLKRVFGAGVQAEVDNGLLVLTGELQRWADIVRAGAMAVDRKRFSGLVNNIKCTGEKPVPPRLPAFKDNVLSGESPDVVIIGGGVTGCATARELSRYDLDVLLVEKEHDLAMQTSGRNDGMVHSGIDLKNGTLKYRYNMQGNKMYGDICNELGVDFNRCGQYLCFNKIWWLPLLRLSLIYWRWHGLSGTKIVGRKKLREKEPSISPKVLAALFFPATGLVCPYKLTIAYAENAVQNGVRVSLDTAVIGIETEGGMIRRLHTNRGMIVPKVVINAAGVFCEDISKMAGDQFYSIHPRKGTNAILDKKYSDAVVRTSLSSMSTASTKTAHTKGGGIMRTVDGNTLVGPDAVETIQREDYSTSRYSVAGTFKRQGRTSPALAESQIINYFSGIRASTYEEDFVVCKGRSVRNIVHAAGIQSPGLTAAPAIGADVARMAVELLGGDDVVKKNPDFDPIRKPDRKTSKMDDTARAELIARNPDYGVIVCRCEEVSKGEILDALRRNIPCDTIDGVKRRVRTGAGRCQGGFCGPLVLDIIAKEKGYSLNEVRKSGAGSELLFGPTKRAGKEKAGGVRIMLEDDTDPYESAAAFGDLGADADTSFSVKSYTDPDDPYAEPRYPGQIEEVDPFG